MHIQPDTIPTISKKQGIAKGVELTLIHKRMDSTGTAQRAAGSVENK
jgi:hypothetical protein